jgi:hypothetical protein
MYLSSCPVMGCSTALDLVQLVGQTINHLKSATRNGEPRQNLDAGGIFLAPAADLNKKALDMY